jgi:sulfatase maturation enzyme AslB (radical SAM superfamily)
MQYQTSNRFHTFQFDGRTIAFDETKAEVWVIKDDIKSKVGNEPANIFLTSQEITFDRNSKSKVGRKTFEENIKTVFFHVTNSCNLSCKYCYSQNIGDDRKSVSTVEEAKFAVESIIQSFPVVKKWHISFLGGEPTTNMPVVETCVEIFSKMANLLEYSVQFTLTTNGTLLTPSIASYLADHRFNVVISLDGPPEIHD